MPVLTRHAVYEAVKAKLPTSKQRAALSQKLGKPWHHASTEAIAQAIGLQGAPKAANPKSARAIAQRHGIAKSYAAEQAAGRLTDDSDRKTAIKQRIIRAVNRELKAHEQQQGRKLTVAEKRQIATKALYSEVQAIKANKPERKTARSQLPANNIEPIKRKPTPKNNIVKSTVGKRQFLLDQLKQVQAKLTRLGSEALLYSEKGKTKDAKQALKDDTVNQLERTFKGTVSPIEAKIVASYKRLFETMHPRKLVKVPKGTTQREFAEIMSKLTEGDKAAIKKYTVPRPKGYKTASDRRYAKKKAEADAKKKGKKRKQ